MNPTRRTILLASALALAAGPVAAQQNWPAKAIRVIVPFTAGGGTDIATRVVMEKVSQQLGASIVIENRGGGGGTIGTDVVAKADADGYVFGVVSASHAVNPSFYDTLPYDSVKDFAPVTILCFSPGVLVVSPSLPVKTVAELVAYAKARPGKLDFASPGNGTPPHLAAELFKTMTGTDIRHVPYKGSSQAYVDIVAGRVPVSFPSLAGAIPMIRTGKLRALAVTGPSRVAAMPELPTVAESGLPGFDAASWYALLAPAGTPVPILERMQREVAKALKLPDVKEKFGTEGLEPAGLTPEESRKLLTAEIEKWGKVVKAAGVRPN